LFSGFDSHDLSSLGGTITCGNYFKTSKEPFAHLPVPVTPITNGLKAFGKPAYDIFFETFANASHIAL